MSSNHSESALAKTFDPAAAQRIAADRWAESEAFTAPGNPPDTEQTYAVLIPPPNVTAALHLGHALNNTLQDVLVRYYRMKGHAVLWMPGTDHAGIATQTVVEKRLLQQGMKRLEIGREKFVEYTKQWKDEYEAVIVDQLKDMGTSCDWGRIRFTMDDMCATAVRHAFYQLFADGLIYRGKRLVNWDPVTLTALADDEVEMEDVDGHMWYLNYPLLDGSGHVTVATTRPETMLGDTAVAVNPCDPENSHLIGQKVKLPIVGREIPIVGDDYVVIANPDGDAKAQYASGFLKVTPAHDPNDWDIGLRHDLDVINVMAADGSISANHGWDDVSDEAAQFVGLSREDARQQIVGWFETNGLLANVRSYQHSVGHSYRSHVPIEPWLSDQWYVAATDPRLRDVTLQAQNPDQVPKLPEGVPERTGAVGDGELTFFPARYAQTYYRWNESIRDWCISRQLWWGHQIPVWRRIVPTGDASADEAVLLNADVGQMVTVSTSPWQDAGAQHRLRRTADGDIEEIICVPPDSTLRRLDRTSDAWNETELITALEAEGFEQDPDVLDTWFSSALWPLSTMGWPWPEDFPETEGLLEAYNPTSVLSTAREIITLWVSRMTMFNRYFHDGKVPFSDVFIHAMVQDGHGQKMSKSLGNGVDPRDIIHSHGADALRFGLVHMTTETQDVRMPVDMVCPYSGVAFTPDFITSPAGYKVAKPVQVSPVDSSHEMVSAYGISSGEVVATDERPLARNTSPKFDLGRNFANKTWNATRFALSRLDGTEKLSQPFVFEQLSFVDRWILSRLAIVSDELSKSIENYQFNSYAEKVYDFVWHDVCDRYLEAIKPTVDASASQKVVLGVVLNAVLRVMQPVCPFLVETLWAEVQAAQTGSIDGVDVSPSVLAASAAWPKILLKPQYTTLATFDRAVELVGLLRALRSERNVKPKQKITLHVPATMRELFDRTEFLIETLAGVGNVVDLADTVPSVVSSVTFEGHSILVSDLTEEVDVEAEQVRLQKIIDAKTKQIAGFEKKLSNSGYVNGAPAELVEQTRSLLAAAQADVSVTQAALANLQ